MSPDLDQALICGFERLAAWAELLDAINVFPVADGDTGRNLVLSLAPLKGLPCERAKLHRRLLVAARGNSGNIASRFFTHLLAAEDLSALPEAVRAGCDAARRAVADPRPGTMLTLLDTLAEVLAEMAPDTICPQTHAIISRLETTVHETAALLPELADANVVDAGALGLFLFFEAFFHHLADQDTPLRPVTQVFRGQIVVSGGFSQSMENGFCVDLVLHPRGDTGQTAEALARLGDHVVVMAETDMLKIHLHTTDKAAARKAADELGDVIGWSDDLLSEQIRDFQSKRPFGPIHIMTDAAGSLTRQDARDLGITLLSSYVNCQDQSLPEMLMNPDTLYTAMRAGVKVSTAQASVYERHQRYASAVSRHAKVLYICVGAFYTGNHETVLAWKSKNDPENRLIIMDSQTASGALGLAALATARFATTALSAEEVVAYARQALQRCREFVFLDKLHYLAAGGRLSKTSAFFGDMLHMKPIISPLAQGAQKIGVKRTRNDQLTFAMQELDGILKDGPKALIMLEYTDNRQWVEAVCQPVVARSHPQAEILIRPMSLTAGAHMGPGTWGIAVLPT